MKNNLGKGLKEYLIYSPSTNKLKYHYTMLNNEYHGECRSYDYMDNFAIHTYYNKNKKDGEQLNYKYFFLD